MGGCGVCVWCVCGEWGLTCVWYVCGVSVVCVV